MMKTQHKVGIGAVLLVAVVVVFGGMMRKPVAPSPPPVLGASSLVVQNGTAKATIVYVSFGSDSVVSPSDWTFCMGSGGGCQFSLAANSSQAMPLGGKYLNATLAFGTAPSCGSTKAELNLNNPTWYDIADVSLVDGYSNAIAIQVSETDAGTVAQLGPPNGPTGNEKVFGLFPLGCDVCVARQSPPCGMDGGTDAGCKSGNQYNPDVICQWQGSVKGGGTAVKVLLTEPPLR